MLEQGASLGPDPALQPGDSGELFGDYDMKGDIYARGAAYIQLVSSAGICAPYRQFYTPPVVELPRAKYLETMGWDLQTGGILPRTLADLGIDSSLVV